MAFENTEYLDFDEAEPQPGFDIAQQSPEWFQARAGKITASRISDVVAGGQGKTREKYIQQLAIERIIGSPMRGGFENEHIRHGIASENEALELYSFQNDAEITRCGFVTHPSLAFAGCSPDALVGVDGMAQVKAPTPPVHLSYLLTKKVPREYALQMQWELACTGRAWSDFVSFDPDQIPRLRLLVIRVERNPGLIAELEAAATLFNAEVEDLVNLMRTL